LTEIEIKNFQSIAHIKFPIEGFTVIYGKNNIGKSAIIRAIKAALVNQTGKGFIKKGEKQTEVKIKKGDLDLTWKKGKSAVYDINNKKYTKLNKDVPKPLIEQGFGKIEIGNKKIMPTMAGQFNPLFLIDEPGSTITEVLASLYNIDTLSIADDLCQKSLRSQKTLLKTRENDVTKLNKELEKYKDFEDVKKKVEDLTEKEKQINLIESEIKDIETFEIRIQQLSESVNKIRPIKDINIPRLSNYEEDFIEIENVKKFEQKYREKSSTVEILKNVNEIEMPLSNEIEDISEKVRLLTEWEEELTALERNIKQKEDILKDIDIKVITASYRNIENIYNELILVEKLSSEFMKIAIQAKETRKESRDVTEKFNEKYAILSKEICPTCERPYGN